MVKQPTNAANQQSADEPVEESSGADSDQGEVEGTDEEEEDEFGRIEADRENSGLKSPPVPASCRSIRKEGAGKERQNDRGKSDADREKPTSKPWPVPAPYRPVRECQALAWMYPGEYQYREVNSTVPQLEWGKKGKLFNFPYIRWHFGKIARGCVKGSVAACYGRELDCLYTL